jgi:hypothetical protein
MAQLARSTGGEAFYDTNGFKEAMEKAVSDGEDYYTFAYTPPERKYNGSYREIDVKTSHPGLQLFYRTGYRAVDPNAPVRAADASMPSALRDSVRLGAPAATQILFEVKLDPEDAIVDKITSGAKPDSAMMKPPYRRLDLVYQVDIGGALFTTSPDGDRHGSLDFAIFVYNSEGALANETTNKVNLDLPSARYAELLQRGLRVGQTVEAPAKGNYFLRIVVYDPKGDRVGTTEVPLADLKSNQAKASHAENSTPPATPK